MRFNDSRPFELTVLFSTRLRYTGGWRFVCEPSLESWCSLVAPPILPGPKRASSVRKAGVLGVRFLNVRVRVKFRRPQAGLARISTKWLASPYAGKRPLVIAPMTSPSGKTESVAWDSRPVQTSKPIPVLRIVRYNPDEVLPLLLCALAV